jgi:hypothetical protein
LAPSGVKVLQNFALAFGMSDDQGLGFRPGCPSIIDHTLPNKVSNILMLPPLLIKHEMIPSNLDRLHSRASQQKPKLGNFLEARRRILGKERLAPVRHSPREGSRRRGQMVEQSSSEQPQLLRGIT